MFGMGELLCRDGRSQTGVTVELVGGHVGIESFGVGHSTFGHSGFGGAGFDDDDLDPEGGNFAAQGITGGLEGELRSRVWAIGRHGELPADRADVHDGARTVQQSRQQRLGHRDVAEQIDFEQPSPVGHRQGFDGRVDRDPGVVDQRPQRTLQRVVGDAAGDGGYVGFVGDVEDVGLDSIGSQRIGVDIAPDPGKHVISPARELSCGGCAHSGRGTGDDHQLVAVGLFWTWHDRLHILS